MSPRIGLIVIGHPDYPNDVGAGFAARAVERLRACGIEIVTEVGVPYTDPIAAGERGLALAGERLDGVIVWLGTWIECSTAIAAIREFEHLPFAIWGFPMFAGEQGRESTGSFVAACVLKGTLERMGYPFKPIFGMPEDEATLEQALAFCRAAHAVQRLKRTRLGLIGYAAMSMYPGTFDHVLMRRIIGPEVVQFDSYTLIRRAAAVKDERAEKVAALVGELGTKATVSVENHRIWKAAALGVALLEIAEDHALNALNVKCQYELSQEYGMTPCVPLSWLADIGIICGCEGDVMTTATQCLLAYLTDQVVTYGDILDLQGGQMLLSSCGFAPFSLASGNAVRLCELGYPGFDGIISSCTLKRGKVTFARLVEGRGDFRLVYGTGTGVDTELRQGRFPALQVQLDGDPQRLLDNTASQHWALCYGDASAGIGDVCRLLGVQAVRRLAAARRVVGAASSRDLRGLSGQIAQRRR